MRAFGLLVLLPLHALASGRPHATFHAIAPDPAHAADLRVKVNGTQVYPSTTPTEVALQPDLDRLEVRLQGKTTSVFARFTPHAAYDVRRNPCSGYELIPRKAVETLPTLHLEVAEGLSQPVHFEGVIEPTDVHPGSDATLEVGRSAMCSLAPIELHATTPGHAVITTRFLMFGGTVGRVRYGRRHTVSVELERAPVPVE